MKINYIILENFSNIDTAMNLRKIKLDFRPVKNKIILMVGPNGIGKTSILSLLTPFATIGNLDIRNTSNLILEGKDGYKEIEIQNKNHTYLIKHCYTPKKPDGHSVKSYISKDGSEMNPNGNVTSFKEWVKEELHVELDYLKLIRLGSNVTSMIDLSETERKTFMNKLLEDADIFLSYYKKVNSDLKQLKDMISHAVDKQNRLGIINIKNAEEDILRYEDDLKYRQDQYNILSGEISVLQHEIDGIEEKETLKIRLNDAKKKYEKTKRILERKDKSYESIEFYEKEIKSIEMEIILRNSKIDAHRVLLTSYLSTLNDLNNKKHHLESIYASEVEVDDNLKSIRNEIERIEDSIKSLEKGLIGIDRPNIEKEEMENFFVFLKNTQQALNRTYEFGKRIVKRVVQLVRKKKNVMQYINGRLYEVQSSDKDDILLERLKNRFPFLESDIPSDPCCSKCNAKDLYIQLANMIHATDDLSKEKESISTLQSMELVYQNLLHILSGFGEYENIVSKLPDGIQNDFIMDIIYDKIEQLEPIFNEEKLNDFLSIITEFHEIDMLSIKRDEIKSLHDKFGKVSNLDYIEKELSSTLSDIDSINEKISDCRSFISSDMETVGELEKTLETYRDILEALTKHVVNEDDVLKLQSEWDTYVECNNDIGKKNVELYGIKNDISYITEKIQNMNLSVMQYKDIQKELKVYREIYDEMTLVKESLSSSKGIPLRYIKNYLGNTEEITNELLDIAYCGDIYIEKFKITQTEFTIPFYNRGKLLRDVKLASQGETSFISLALAFALSSQTMKDYNIMLLDEVDSTLDIRFKEKFIKILENQMERIDAEQCFFITHSNMFSSYPVDVINFGKDGDIYKGTIPIEKL